MNIGIYSIQHISGKLYVGQSFDIDSRLKAHRYLLNRNDHHCKHLQHAWNKYGPSQFTKQQIICCSLEDLDVYEDLVFSTTPRYLLYNTQLKSRAGYIKDDATKTKISNTLKGRIRGPMSAETAGKISKALSKKHIIATNGAQILHFHSMASVKETLDISIQTVWNCLNGRQRQSKGWFFTQTSPNF